MELPTYTSVFRLRRRLYAVYDWELPVPIGLLEVGVFAAGVGLFAGLARVLGIELTAASAWFFVVPPGFLAYLARQPVADHKQPHAWVAAQLRYLLEPRFVHRLADSSPRRLAKARATAAVAEAKEPAELLALPAHTDGLHLPPPPPPHEVTRTRVTTVSERSGRRHTVKVNLAAVSERSGRRYAVRGRR